MATATTKPSRPFKIHAKQEFAWRSKATEILFGGAAGGGKSHLLRLMAIFFALSCPGIQIYLFRRTYKELLQNHVHTPLGFLWMLKPYILAKRVLFQWGALRFDFDNGSQIHLCHLKSDSELDNYLGTDMHVLLIDEMTRFPDAWYRFLRSRVRMPKGAVIIPPQLKGRIPMILSGSNPGGVGHNGARQAFIDPAPPFEIWRTPPDEGGMLRQFIPAKLADNPALDEEEYRSKLMGLGDEALVQAMLEGSWDAVVGAFFDDCWDRRRQVLEPFEIPSHWRRFRAFDWGSARPSACIWFAVSDGLELQDRHIPQGSLIAYRELYTWNGKANEGDRSTNEVLGQRIAELSVGEEYRGCVADPSIFTEMGGPSIYQRMLIGAERWAQKNGAPSGILHMKGADNRRISQDGRVVGWQQVRQMLKESRQDRAEAPGLWFTSQCLHSLRTLPVAVRDLRRPDDVDTDQEDHVLDCIRYACNTILKRIKPKDEPRPMPPSTLGAELSQATEVDFV